MNGPDHYKEAERLLDQSSALPGRDLMPRALVHATLALAAATIEVALAEALGSAWLDTLE